MHLTTYKTISSEQEIELVSKRSIFHGMSFQVGNIKECKEKLEMAKTRHPKANHHCYAYKVGMEKSCLFKMSDNGEPRSTAGLPIFQIIEKNGITNSLIVIARYFGGTLLGRGGLIRTYSQTAQKVLDISHIEKKEVVIKIKLTAPFTQMNTLYSYLHANGIREFKQTSDLFKSSLILTINTLEYQRIKKISSTLTNCDLTIIDG